MPMPEQWWSQPQIPSLGNQIPEVAQPWGMPVTLPVDQGPGPQLQDAPPIQAKPLIGPESPTHPDYVVPAPSPKPVSIATKPPSPTTPKLPSFGQGMVDQQRGEQQALAQHETAIDANTQAQQGLHAEQGAALRQNIAQLDAAEQSHKQIRDQIDKAHQANTAIVQADQKAVDSYKVNPNKFMDDLGVGGHIRWGIGMVLAGIGQGMMRQGGPNPVLQMMQDRMKEAVQLQIDQRDQLTAKLGRAKDTRSEADQSGAGRLAEVDRGVAQAEHVLAKQFDLAANNAADPATKAAALAAKAQLLDSSNQHHESFIKLQSEHDVQQQQLGMQRQQVAIAGGHLSLAAQAEKRAQKLQDLEYGPGGFKEQELGIKAAAELRKGMQEKKDKAKAEGLFNPTTAQPLLTKAGRDMMQQADAVEIAARTDPAKAAQMYVDSLSKQVVTPDAKAKLNEMSATIKQNPAAAQELAKSYVDKLRSDANSESAVIPDKEDRRKVVEGMQYGQDLINASGKIKAFLSSDPDITDREGWAKVQTEYGDAIARYIKSLGANASSREFEAISGHVMKYDPDSLIDRTFRKAPGKASLEGLETAVKSGVNSMLKARGVDDEWVPSSPEDHPATNLGGRTGDEAAAAVDPGNAQKFAAGALDSIAQVATGGSPVHVFAPRPGDEWDVQKRAREASDAASPSPYGLPKETDDKLKGLIDQAETGNNAKRNQIIEQIVDPIKKNDRPALSMGLLRTVKDVDPQLYEDVLARLPPMQVEEIRKFDTPINALEPTGTHPRKSTIKSVEDAKAMGEAEELKSFKNRR